MQLQHLQIYIIQKSLQRMLRQKCVSSIFETSQTYIPTCNKQWFVKNCFGCGIFAWNAFCIRTTYVYIVHKYKYVVPIDYDNVDGRCVTQFKSQHKMNTSEKAIIYCNSHNPITEFIMKLSFTLYFGWHVTIFSQCVTQRITLYVRNVRVHYSFIDEKWHSLPVQGRKLVSLA